MTRQFTVRIAGTSPQAELHRQVLASLPEHFRIVPDGTADAILWSGGADGGRPTARVLVLDGGAAPLAPGDGTLVVPAPRYAPRLCADAGFARARAAPFKLITITGTVAVTGGAAAETTTYLDLCACLRLLTPARPRIASLVRTNQCLAATLRLQGQPAVVSLSVVRSPAAPDMSLDAVGDTLRLCARLDAAAMARPGLIELNAADGCSRVPAIYQHDHRLTWQDVHAVLTGGEPRWRYRQDDRDEDAAELRAALAGALAGPTAPATIA